MLDLRQKHSYLHRLWGRVKVSGYQHKRQGRHGTLPFVATSRGPAQQAKWSTHLSRATGATPPSPPTPAAEDDGRGWDGCLPRDGGGRSKQRQAEPPGGAEAAFAGLERGGTAAPVSPPHPEGARRLRGVKRLEGWVRLACLRRRTSPPLRARSRWARARTSRLAR